MARWAASSVASCVCRAGAGRVAGGNRVSESGDVSANAAGAKTAAAVAVGVAEWRHLRIGRAGGYDAPWGRLPPFCQDPTGWELFPLRGGVVCSRPKGGVVAHDPSGVRARY